MSERDEGVVRMDSQMWALVAQIEAARARVEAMRAENEQRIRRDAALAYGDEAFFEQAGILDSLASALQVRV